MVKKEGSMQSGLSLRAISLIVGIALALIGLIIAGTRAQGVHEGSSYHGGAVPIEEKQWEKVNKNEADIGDLQTSDAKLDVMQRVLVSDVAELKTDVKKGFSKLEDLIRNQ